MIQHLKRVLSSWPVGLFAALLVLAVSTPSARAQDAYSIGIVPQFEARKLIDDSGLRMIFSDNMGDAAEKAVRITEISKLAEEADVGVQFSLPL